MTEQIMNDTEAIEAKTTAVKLLSQTDETATVGGYGVIFGGVDLEGDTFTAETDFMLDLVPAKNIYYDHSLGDVQNEVGKSISETVQDAGIWVEAQITRSKEYAEEILDLVERGVLGWSSGSVGHLVRMENMGGRNVIKTWPVIEYSLTPTPAEPRTVGVELIKQLAADNPDLEALIPQETGEVSESATAGDVKAIDINININTSAETHDTEPMEVMKMTTELQDTGQFELHDVAAIAAEAAKLAADEAVKAYREQLENEKVNKGGFATGDSIKAGKDLEADRPFATFGEQLKAIAQAAMPGQGLDRRLLAIKASGLNEGTPSEGGFLVQQDFATDLFSQAFGQSEILSRTTSIPISANANGTKITLIDETSRANGSRWGGVLAYWAAEAATVTASNPTFRQVSLDLKKLFGLAYATEENLMDAAQLEAVVGESFREEMTFKSEDAVINGTGAGTPLGILNAGCRVDVAKETGQAADTVVVENIDKMWSRMHPRFKANAIWLVNTDTWPQLASLNRAVGTGGATAFMPAGGVSGAPYASLYNRPIIESEYSATVGDLGDIMLVDLSQYYLAQKGAQRAESSMHVRFLYDEMTYRIIWRLDGQPKFASALTPYKGTNTLSPFVAVAAR